MIPAYIIEGERKKQEQHERQQQIQLEIPDYTAEYIEWKRRNELNKGDQEQETVVIIDIY